MIVTRKIELLAPAKNSECGMEAINHGADAVYIGAPKFSARAAAGNSIEDIAQLVTHAHLFQAKVYVALNTLLKDEELAETESLIWELDKIGVDAIIVQDMGITQLKLPPIALHASTQTDNRTAEKVLFLEKAGFEQVVLARELSLVEIKQISKITTVPLEFFIHGSLCVSYSGQCYVSEAYMGRSANRGTCGQFCRLPFHLVDSEGTQIVKNKHLLSLKDLNQSEQLEALIDAGVSSLKIEGRLKDITYVKNVVAYYRQKIDEILKRRPEYTKASSGSCTYTFKPQLEKSFSRGSTTYFLNNRTTDITSFDTPKSLGEEMGRVKEIKGNSFTLAGVKNFNNGDGACFINEQGDLSGFRINRVEDNRIFPAEMPRIAPKTLLYRNFDQEFDKLLNKPSSTRKIGVNIHFSEIENGFNLELLDEDHNQLTLPFTLQKEIAKTPQTEQIKAQLSKLGNTPFVLNQITLELTENWFIPSSLLSDWKRQAIEKLLALRLQNRSPRRAIFEQTTHPYPLTQLNYLGNVLNKQASQFYHQHGVQTISPAFEKESPKEAVLMFCKHCIRYSMGWCPAHQGKESPFKEPFYLLANDKRFKLAFNCKDCQMEVSLVK